MKQSSEESIESTVYNGVEFHGVVGYLVLTNKKIAFRGGGMTSKDDGDNNGGESRSWHWSAIKKFQIVFSPLQDETASALTHGSIKQLLKLSSHNHTSVSIQVPESSLLLLQQDIQNRLMRAKANRAQEQKNNQAEKQTTATSKAVDTSMHGSDVPKKCLRRRSLQEDKPPRTPKTPATVGAKKKKSIKKTSSLTDQVGTPGLFVPLDVLLPPKHKSSISNFTKAKAVTASECFDDTSDLSISQHITEGYFGKKKAPLTGNGQATKEDAFDDLDGSSSRTTKSLPLFYFLKKPKRRTSFGDSDNGEHAEASDRSRTSATTRTSVSSRRTSLIPSSFNMPLIMMSPRTRKTSIMSPRTRKSKLDRSAE